MIPSKRASKIELKYKVWQSGKKKMTTCLFVKILKKMTFQKKKLSRTLAQIPHKLERLFLLTPSTLKKKNKYYHLIDLLKSHILTYLFDYFQ
jgi:hypothetical protein